MKKINFKLNSIFPKIKAFFVKINPFKKKFKISFSALKNLVSKNKILFGGIVAIVIAFVSGYYIKNFFIAATVNGSIISRIEVIKELEKRGGSSVLETLVTEKLLKQYAKKQNITVSKEDINLEISNIEENLKGQATDLNTELAAQKMTLDDLKNQILIRKLVEKIFADKIAVTDEEITSYMTDNGIALPEGSDETNIREIVRQQIVTEKMGQELQPLLDTLKKEAKINTFVKY